MEKTFLVQVTLGKSPDLAMLEEFQALAHAAGASVLGTFTANRSAPDVKTFVGSGKVQEIREQVQALDIDLVIFNNELTPSQERNLEKELSCRVISRTGLILDIFAKRARSFEGKLQIELAQLKHMATRLVRGWTHLERQKGGIGLRGPGETQLETDRRLLRDRIQLVEERLDKVKQQRALSRRARQKQEIPVVALVGYTNAGKSTLFNALTGADVWEADQLFATLDPTHRTLSLPGIGTIILVDTVGFIRDLPHELVEAFHATLEETLAAELLLHVIDAASPEKALHIQQVDQVLIQLGAEKIPTLAVYNKIDACYEPIPPHINTHTPMTQVWVSAREKQGLLLLQEVITTALSQNRILGHLWLSPAQGRIRAALHEMEAVSQETVDQEGHFQIELSVLPSLWQQLCHTEPTLDAQLTRHI